MFFEVVSYGTKAWRAILLLSLCPLWIAVSPKAHELRPLIATLNPGPDAHLELTLSINLEAAIAGIGADHSDTDYSPEALRYNDLRAMDSAELKLELDQFLTSFLDRISLLAGASRLTLELSVADIPPLGDISLPRFSTLVLQTAQPVNEHLLSWRLDPRLGHSVIRVANPRSGEITFAEMVKGGEQFGPLFIENQPEESRTAAAWRYVMLGFLHILPHGPDHILFVVGLYLLATRLGPLLWQITAFTLAHTATLTLGLLGIVQLPPHIVEPLIAASIIYVAVENLLTEKLHVWRPAIVFVFGLLHGLGFAGLLLEIGIPPAHFVTGLVSFNAGVELGQIAVLLLCFILTGWCLAKPWYRPAVAMPASLAIAIIALYWLVQRTNFLPAAIW